MESSLLKGDRVLVNKTAYGIRIPITILSTPFTYDRIFGYKSYSTLIELPYMRLFSDPVKRNDVVLFNNPNESERPLDKRSLLLSRCVGLPGDTVSVMNGQYFINGKEYISSPDMIESYSFGPLYIDTVKTLLKQLDIPERKTNITGDTILPFYLSKVELYLINENLDYPKDLYLSAKDTVGYRFIIPYKGMDIKLNPENSVLYEQAINFEMNKAANKIKASLKKEKIAENTNYTFIDDYYWMLCDNTIESIDSRILGFIPHKSVIGQVSMIWYSKKDSINGRQRNLSGIN